MRRTIIACIILAAACGGAYLWQAARRPPPVPAERLVEPKVGDIVRGVIAVGRVEPRTRIDVKSKANGIVRKLNVDVAEPVRKGQVIVDLDREILQAGLDEAEGRLQGAKGDLESAKAEVARLEVEKTDPELAYAQRNWERAQKLHPDGLISDDERDLARDRCDKARYKIKLLDAQIDKARALLASAEGKLREIGAGAELARQELLEATIVSPIDGVVLHRYLEEGDSVSSIRVAGGNATIIMTLGDLSELYVDGEVDENDVGKIIDAQKILPNLAARVKVSSFPQKVFVGRVARIAPLGLEDSNGIVTFEVRIVFDNPERLLLANMTANSTIVLQEKKDVLLISQGALVTERDYAAEKDVRYAVVYDPATGRTVRKKVEAGITDGSQVEIASGLQPGEKVLVP
jgi:HlyD family secretion protein